MAVVRVAGHELFGVPVNEQFPIALHDNGDGTFSIVVYDTNAKDGTVTAVYAGAGLTGGPITSSGSLSLPNIGTPGTYALATITTDVWGRVVLASSGSEEGIGTVTAVYAGSGLSGGPITSSGSLAIGIHDHSTNVFGGKLVQASTHESPDTDAATSSLHHTLGSSATQAAAGSHAHIGMGTVTNVYAGAGLTGGPITTSGSLALPTLGVSGSYTNASLTLDSYGRVTFASSGVGVVAAKQTEIDFGATPIDVKDFTITDADVVATSNIMVQVAYIAPTGKELDELDFDVFDFRAVAGTGNFTLHARSLEGLVADKFKVIYFLSKN